jgi:CheY-like chemotaxis protein
VADSKKAHPPTFGDLAKHSRAIVDGLEALESTVAGDLADLYAEVRRLKDRLAIAERDLTSVNETNQRLAAESAANLEAERDRLEAEFRALRLELDTGRQEWADERDALQEEQKALQASHDDQLAELQQQLAARQQALDERMDQVHQLQAQVDDVAGAQLTLAADRQQIADQLEELRSTHDAIQIEYRTLVNQLVDARAEVDTLQGYQLQWATERENLLIAAKTRKDEFEKLRRSHLELITQANQLNTDTSARRETLIVDIQQLKKELDEAVGALGRSHDREKLREKAVTELKESWQREKMEFEIALRDARNKAAAVPVSPEHLHSLRSHVNAITGFSELVLQEGPHAVSPEEARVFLRQVNDSSKRFAQELARISTPTPDPNGADGNSPLESEPAPPLAEILLADPDPDSERVAAFLTRAGYHVSIAANTKEAMETASSAKPIVVLIEADLPTLGAAQLIEELRRERRTRDVPVIITSTDRRMPAHIEGAHLDFLPKPIDLQRLLQTLVKMDLLAANSRASHMPASVLVIDDDPQHVKLVETTLKPYQINVLSATDGQRGLELAEERHPEVVIVDLKMPDVDGFVVIDALRAKEETSAVPIIVYSAKQITKADQARLSGKVQSIITKGEFNKDRLLDLIQKRGERRHRSRSESDRKSQTRGDAFAA